MERVLKGRKAPLLRLFLRVFLDIFHFLTLVIRKNLVYSESR